MSLYCGVVIETIECLLLDDLCPGFSGFWMLSIDIFPHPWILTVGNGEK